MTEKIETAQIKLCIRRRVVGCLPTNGRQEKTQNDCSQLDCTADDTKNMVVEPNANWNNTEEISRQRCRQGPAKQRKMKKARIRYKRIKMNIDDDDAVG